MIGIRIDIHSTQLNMKCYLLAILLPVNMV